MKRGKRLFFNLLLLGSLTLTSAVASEDAIFDDEGLDWLLTGKLPTVNVASQKKEEIKDAPGIVSVITDKDIKRWGARDIGDIFDRIPGFQSSIMELGRQTPVVRGVKTRNMPQVKMLIDGVHVNDLIDGTAFTAYSKMPLDDVKSIEIIRGPGSSLYGENAMVAVISIITKGAKDIDGVKATARFGSFDHYGGNVQIGKVTEQLQYSVIVDYDDTEGYCETVDSDAWSSSRFQSEAPGEVCNDTTRLNAQAKVDFNNTSLLLRYTDVEKKPIFGVPSNVNTDTVHEIQELVLSLSHTIESDNYSITPKFTFWESQRDYMNLMAPKGFNLPFDADGDGDIEVWPMGKFTNPNYTNNRISGGIDFHYRGFESHDLLIGVNYDVADQKDLKLKANWVTQPRAFSFIGNGYDLVDVTESLTFGEEKDRVVFSVFAQDQITLSDQLILSLGSRYDDYDDVDAEVTPRASLVWKATEKMNMKFLYGRAFRVPNFTETYEAQGSSLHFLGNGELESETIDSYEIGLYYNISEATYFGINAFHNEVTGLVDLATFGVSNYMRLGGGAGGFTNAVDVDYDGIELEGRVRFAEKVICDFNYSYCEGENDEGVKIENFSNHKAFISFDFLLTDNLAMNLASTYYSEIDRPDYDPREAIDAYNIVDLNIIFNYMDWELALSAHNLLDEEYYSPDPQGLIWGDFPMSGVDVVGKISRKF